MQLGDLPCRSLGVFPHLAALCFLQMYLLCLDDSGSVKNASDRHIILAGVAVFERQSHWLAGRLDAIAGRVWPDGGNSIEFRGSSIHAGRDHWRGLGKMQRIEAYKDALRQIGTSRNAHLFGAVVHKAAVSPNDPMEAAFEQVSMRFDKFLGRLHNQGNTQRGLIILDKSSYETSLQGLTTKFRTDGHHWGQLYNVAEVPLFVDSRATRMIQYADMVAYALRRYYENGEATYFDLIKTRFDAEGGVVHGLTHYVPANENCNCLSCRQKHVR